jgi:alkaline phosphatase D
MIQPQQIRAAVAHQGGLSRRLMLAYGASLATIPTFANRTAAVDRKVAFQANPFSLGVASGDPDARSVVLWTKLAPQPMEADGGMPSQTVSVRWEIAEDDSMKKVVASGTAVATPQLGHSVHVTVRGLEPDRWYWYQFKVADAVSPVGRTRTLPAPDTLPETFKFAVASCQHYESGLFTAYEQMAQDDVDLVFHLGDYIYEYPHHKGSRVVRQHNGPTDGKIKSLADYRQRYMLYRADPLLNKMHAQCPWFLTWDDHEFDNNCAGDIPEEKNVYAQDHLAEFLIQRAAAYQAYYEMMPLRRRSMPQGPHMRLYRKAAAGRLAEFFVLDTRQYRTDQPNGDKHSPLNEAALAETNSLLGGKQRNWLDRSLISSTSTWNVLAQQVMMGMVDRKIGEEVGYSMDQWPGAAHERGGLLQFIADRKVPNPVVLTGDIHSNWANELRVDDLKPETPLVATEFVCTSISSGGNGQKEVAGLDALLGENPFVKFHNRQRGYINCTLTPETWRSDYKVTEDVLKPGGKTVTRASFVVEAGDPAIKPA